MEGRGCSSSLCFVLKQAMQRKIKRNARKQETRKRKAYEAKGYVAKRVKR